MDTIPPGTAVVGPAPVRWPALGAALTAGALLLVAIADSNPRRAMLLLVGCALGFTLYHSAFGFTTAYRRALAEGDISGVTAQIVMLAAAVILFAPVLAAGEILGQRVGGAYAPVSVSMALGALMFGVGMQMGGGCASGTLYTAGGGSPRMLVVLVFFCAGCFVASLHLAWWQSMPGIGTVSLGQRLGWASAAGLQVGALGALYACLRLAGGRNHRALWWSGRFRAVDLARGPWPLLLGAGLLALLNLATLLIAGHPWSITWGFTLWAAKSAVALGWDPGTSAFWSGGFQQGALARSVLEDTTSVMNFGILLGALAASALAARRGARTELSLPSLLAAILGGLLLGYGARLAYGCNVGAFFSGVASSSLHGWVWIAAAAVGNVIGLRVRSLFHLDG